MFNLVVTSNWGSIGNSGNGKKLIQYGNPGFTPRGSDISNWEKVNDKWLKKETSGRRGSVMERVGPTWEYHNSGRGRDGKFYRFSLLAVDYWGGRDTNHPYPGYPWGGPEAHHQDPYHWNHPNANQQIDGDWYTISSTTANFLGTDGSVRRYKYGIKKYWWPGPHTIPSKSVNGVGVIPDDYVIDEYGQPHP
ncbi:MAG: hypothetical protein R6V56_07515 [Lentisphaeria bacterium]